MGIDIPCPGPPGMASSMRPGRAGKPRKSMRNDTRAGIEGLPLQLMIMVVVAGLGTAILIGWMGSLSAPTSIGSVTCDQDEIVLQSQSNIATGSGISLKITVLDSNGDAVQGASVVLDGCKIEQDGRLAHGTTGDDGTVTLSGLSATLANKNVGFITVTVSKTGLGTDSSLTIPVVAE